MQDAGPRGDDDPIDAAAPAPAPLRPFLPVGDIIFSRLPATAIVLSALPGAVGQGIILAEDSTSIGLVAIREGQVSRSLCIEHSTVISDVDVFAHISSWKHAVVSATRLSTEELDLVDQQLAGDACYHDLRLEWIDWKLLLSDLRARLGSYLVVLLTPSGSGAITISGDADVRTYGKPLSATTGSPGLEELVKERMGVVHVFRISGDPKPQRTQKRTPLTDAISPPSEPLLGRPQEDRNRNVPAGSQRDRNTLAEIFGVPSSTASDAIHEHEGDALPSDRVDVRRLLPDLKLLVRSRLGLSSGRLEAILDEADAAGRPIDSVASDIRNLSVRGVMQSTLDQLADDIVAMSTPRAR